jgi:hypothetical protein
MRDRSVALFHLGNFGNAVLFKKDGGDAGRRRASPPCIEKLREEGELTIPMNSV